MTVHIYKVPRGFADDREDVGTEPRSASSDVDPWTSWQEPVRIADNFLGRCREGRFLRTPVEQRPNPEDQIGRRFSQVTASQQQQGSQRATATSAWATEG